MSVWDEIARTMQQQSGRPVSLSAPMAVGGGCINDSMSVTNLNGAERYFVKLNTPHRLAMFEAEAEGLAALRATKTLVVPEVLAVGSANDQSFLVLEHLDFAARSRHDERRFGAELAAMHRHTSERYGWHRDNTIGTTPQRNAWAAKWIDFWRDQRLGYQFKLAADNGAPRRLLSRGEALSARIHDFFEDYTPVASLLHGDLWSGNAHALANGRTAIFDPAVYYGDRETDIAMTELFGGFGPDFYDGYHAAYPLDDGYAYRKRLYNLYHVLNHFNLFGGGYAGQAEHMIDRLLSHLG